MGTSTPPFPRARSENSFSFGESTGNSVNKSSRLPPRFFPAQDRPPSGSWFAATLANPTRA